MGDSKANGLVKRVFSSLADITGVRIWSQKDGEDDALGIEMSETLSSNIVADGSTLDFKALTPKGFAASVATETRKGIVELATDAEVLSETSSKIVTADQQAKQRANWWNAKTGDQYGMSKIPHTEDAGRVFKFTYTLYYLSDGSTKTFYIFDTTKIATGKRLMYLTIAGIYDYINARNKIDNVFLDAVSGAELRFNNDNDFKLVVPGSTSPPYILITNTVGYHMLSFDVYAVAK